MNSNLVIFILFYSILLITKTLSDICNVCHCDVQNKNNTIFIHCGSGVNNNLTLELENIQWPIDEAFIVVGLNEQNFSYIPKILGTDKVISLNLENNLIEYITPDPFQYVKNVEYISLKNNSIAELNKDDREACLDLSISHCNNLMHIHPDAFGELYMCKLDLSYNNLYVLSENLTNWANLVNGINLQGNPFICSCSSQWMLDTILNQLYENEEQQYLLKDLRCGNSESFGGHRFVHYYRRIGALCNPSVPLKMQQEETLYAGFGNLQLNRGPGVFIITLLCFIILIALVFLGIYFTKEQKKKLSRVNQKFQFYDY